MIENEVVQSGLYADWSEVPQNIPVTGSFFEVSNHLVFDDSTPIWSDENGEN